MTTVVATYKGKSKKGYAPYNPKKANQDAMIMLEHAETNVRSNTLEAFLAC